MLTKNVWQIKGLYNGALGTVKAILYAEGAKPPELPRCVLVEFDDYVGPSIIPGEKIVPIIPAAVPFDSRSGKQGSRQQLPLVLGWATTIHKSQGLTLDRALVDVGVSEINPGATYVACSRVRTPQGLAFFKSFPFERMRRLNDSGRLRVVSDEIQRLATLAHAQLWFGISRKFKLANHTDISAIVCSAFQGRYGRFIITLPIENT
jgi:ATP-dependent DNA helicase PIF1